MIWRRPDNKPLSERMMVTHVCLTRRQWVNWESRKTSSRIQAEIKGNFRDTSHGIPRVHYGDVIMTTMASQITSLTVVYSIVYSGADQRNIKSPRHWPLYGEFTGDRWIPRTNGQFRGKCFHLMTSSWYDALFLLITDHCMWYLIQWNWP